MRVMCLHVTALRDIMALHVNISTPVHDLHANTILRVRTSRVLSTCAFVNQDIQVRIALKLWLCMVTVEKYIEKTKEVDHLYIQHVDGRMMINWILKKLKGGCGLNSSCS
jgi:hypothetical protein